MDSIPGTDTRVQSFGSNQHQGAKREGQSFEITNSKKLTRLM